MPSFIDQRDAIEKSLALFKNEPLQDAARKLFETLGYKSDRRVPIATAKQFRAQLDPQGKLTAPEIEAIDRLQSLHLLFQLTDTELGVQHGLFVPPNALEESKIESYLFFAGELPEGQYSRTDLSKIIRAINKPLPMPAIILLKHGDRLSLGIIHRRLHKRDQTRDVLEKVTLVKDIHVSEPIRAHLEILNDFTRANLDAEFGVSNFVGLHEAWRKRLDTYELSKGFYREIADWYFWAHHQVDDKTIRLPQHCDTEQERSLFLIRLLTRVIFCWFLVEKRLIPQDLFRDRKLRALLKDFAPSQDPKKPDSSPVYYRAILQNLFFGTLNMPPEQREFRKKAKAGQRYDQNYGVTNLWRYEAAFTDPAAWEAVAKRVPFLNGGLFDCLDDKSGKKKDNFILDGFSDREDFGCHLPNDLFFGPERTVDLSRDYGEEDKRTARSKKAKVRGLFGILSRYKFTIEENTPLEEEIALDPELLGKVFENLLASYNEDTRTTARKALGAFYTPREIVGYMVDEALKSYLSTQVPGCKGALEDLFSNKATLKDIKPDTKDKLVAAIGRVKILDPACGSGAFPMGALHRLVDLLQKLDPDNEAWQRHRIADAQREREQLAAAGAPKDRLADIDARIEDIKTSFNNRLHNQDYARKLFLIENCIYGVDIQPIATQIAKLRFFISLIVDQKVDTKAANLGVRALPNLETRLVAADALIPVERSEGDLFMADLDRLRAELAEIRHEHFNARTPATKRKWRERDQIKRQEIAQRLENEGSLSHKSAKKLAAWDPYDQNVSAPFFDAEWMFGRTVADANRPKNAKSNEYWFDVVLGNPPYVRQEQIKHLKDDFKKHYACFTGTADLYVYFYEASIRLLRSGGIFSFITSNKWFRAAYGEKLRTWLPQATRLLRLIDFGDAPVFTAIAYPCIVIAQRTDMPPSKDDAVRALAWEVGPPIDTFADVFARRSFAISQGDLRAEGWRVATGVSLGLLDRLRSAGKPLREAAGSRVYRGITTGLNDAFVVDRETRDRLIAEHPSSRELLKPFRRGRDVNRWAVGSEDSWLVFTRHGTDIRKFPAIQKYLQAHRLQLTPGAQGGRKPGTYEWFEIQDNIAYWREFEKPKIVSTKVSRRPTFALDNDGLYYGNTSYFIPASDDSMYLLGLLNSNVYESYARRVFVEKQAGWYEVQPQGLEAFPIARATDLQKLLVSRLASYMVWLTSEGTKGTERRARDDMMTATWERVINALAYELYFPSDIKDAGVQVTALVAEIGFVDLEVIPQSARLERLRSWFEILNEGTHALRIALDRLQTLDIIRVIEGQK